MDTSNENRRADRIILPVQYPFITTYTQHAHLLSILSCYECTYPWIYSNYIQLYINKDYCHDWGDFYFPLPYELRPSDTCKWIHSQKIDRSIAESKWGSIIDFIADFISSDNYVHLMINYFHVPQSMSYQKDNTIHDVLVYGYDLSKETIYFSDFLNSRKYSFEEISFTDFINAFTSYKQRTNDDYLKGIIYLYRFDSECDYEFNINNILNSIKAYLSDAAPEYWDFYNMENKRNIDFGTEVYRSLGNYVRRMVDNGLLINIRPFYLLYDHKKLMLLRLKFLHGLKSFTNADNNLIGMENIEKQAKNLVNMTIKYNISGNKALADKILNLLNDIKKGEYEILRQYID